MPMYYLIGYDQLIGTTATVDVWSRFKNPATGRTLKVTPLVVVGDGVPSTLYTEPGIPQIISKMHDCANRCPRGSAVSWWVCSNHHTDTMVNWSDTANRKLFIDNLKTMRQRADAFGFDLLFDAEDYRNTNPPGGGQMDQSKAWLPTKLPPISAQEVADAMAQSRNTVGYYSKSFEHWMRYPASGRSWMADWVTIFAGRARQNRSRVIHLCEDFNIVIYPQFVSFLKKRGIQFYPGFTPDGLGNRPVKNGWIFDMEMTMLKAALPGGSA